MVFTFTGLALPILSVSLDGGSTLVPNALTSNANQVFVNYQCLGYIQNNISTIINVTFDSSTPTKRTTWGRLRQYYR